MAKKTETATKSSKPQQKETKSSKSHKEKTSDKKEKNIKKVTVKREKKDPNAPKKAGSSYNFFCVARRPELKSENADLKPTEVMKKLGEMWKTLSADDKKVFLIVHFLMLKLQSRMKNWQPKIRYDIKLK
jgi:hypothetical protein